MKKKIVIGTVAVATVGGVGVAWALLGGVITFPNVAEGLAVGSSSASCQNTAINWSVPDPTFDTQNNTYEIASVNFTGFSADCVTAGAALELQVIDSNGDFLTTGGVTPSGTTGTVAVPAMPYSLIIDASFIYLVSE